MTFKDHIRRRQRNAYWSRGVSNWGPSILAPSREKLKELNMVKGLFDRGALTPEEARAWLLRLAA